MLLALIPGNKIIKSTEEGEKLAKNISTGLYSKKADVRRGQKHQRADGRGTIQRLVSKAHFYGGIWPGRKVGGR